MTYVPTTKQLREIDVDDAVDLLPNNRQRKFLRAYTLTGTVAGARRAMCRGSSMRKTEHNRWMATDAMYRRVFEYVRDTADHVLEQVAYDRAVNGWQEPVYFQGEVVGYITRHDNSLLFKMLSRLSNRYNAESQLNIQASGNVQINLPDNGRGDRMEEDEID